MTDLHDSITRWRSAAVDDAELGAILDAAAGENLLQYIFDLRWTADMRAIKRWQKRTGRTLTHPDHADLVVWLLDERDKEKSKSWWQGAIVGAVTILCVTWGYWVA